MKRVFSFIYSWFLISCTYFCLWTISDYLLHQELLAFLFFPFAFRIGILLHSPKIIWLSTYFAECSIIFLLQQVNPDFNAFPLYLLMLFSFPLIVCGKYYYQGHQRWQLYLQGLLTISVSILNAGLMYLFNFDVFYIFLISFTGMVLFIPMCYLLYDFLFKRKWIPITATLIHNPIRLRIKHIISYLSLFVLNLVIQNYLPDEFHRFSLFFLAIPIVLLAYYYGWQGALLATLLNSVALIVAIHHFSYLDLSALMLSLSLQTIMGIFLGLASQYQRELNQHLVLELERNRQLSRQLIHNEETIRKHLSQELHDEIGQNITAIRTQAAILKRLNPVGLGFSSSSMIEKLSLNIYDTVKSLLNRIRPRLLDDFSLHQALENLPMELGFHENAITFQLEWHNPENLSLDPVLEITLYRLCQESLNNVIKHAQATWVKIHIDICRHIQISIVDNGVGFDPNTLHSGLGIKGMKERVNLLGGEFALMSAQHQGTQIQVQLPRI